STGLLQRRRSMSTIRRTLLTVLGFVILSHLFASRVQAQTGNISGTITDSSRRVLVGAQVHVEGRPLSTVSDESGKYTLLRVAAGSIRVKVSYLGFESSSLDVTVMAGSTATLDFALGLPAIST